jgi:hypothetical protein
MKPTSSSGAGFVVDGIDNLPERLPLSALLELVAKYRGSREVAKKFILVLYSQQSGRWLFDRLTIGAPIPDPAQWTRLPEEDVLQDSHAVYWHLWQGTEWLTVDWETSNIVYDGPLITRSQLGPPELHDRFARNVGRSRAEIDDFESDLSRLGPVFDERWRVGIGVECALMPTAPVIKRLRFLGLLPPAGPVSAPPMDTPLPEESKLTPAPGKTTQWVLNMFERVAPKGFSRTGYAKDVLAPRNSSVKPKTLINIVVNLANDPQINPDNRLGFWTSADRENAEPANVAPHTALVKKPAVKSAPKSRR